MTSRDPWGPRCQQLRFYANFLTLAGWVMLVVGVANEHWVRVTDHDVNAGLFLYCMGNVTHARLVFPNVDKSPKLTKFCTQIDEVADGYGFLHAARAFLIICLVVTALAVMFSRS